MLHCFASLNNVNSSRKRCSWIYFLLLLLLLLFLFCLFFFLFSFFVFFLFSFFFFFFFSFFFLSYNKLVSQMNVLSLTCVNVGPYYDQRTGVANAEILKISNACSHDCRIPRITGGTPVIVDSHQ